MTSLLVLTWFCTLNYRWARKCADSLEPVADTFTMTATVWLWWWSNIETSAKKFYWRTPWTWNSTMAICCKSWRHWPPSEFYLNYLQQVEPNCNRRPLGRSRWFVFGGFDLCVFLPQECVFFHWRMYALLQVALLVMTLRLLCINFNAAKDRLEDIFRHNHSQHW